MSSSHRRAVGLARGLLVALFVCAGPSWAQTGVDDDRVSLPEGPGSLEGVGENVDIDPNMGLMRYSVPFTVPEGFAGATPMLALSYSSGAGNGIAGMGWTMDVPMIERMTYRGLPRYTLDDDIAAGGGAQIMRIPGTDPPVFRARFEKTFTRYTWLGTDDGRDGYWLAEMPDGTKQYYGATADGVVVDAARMRDEVGTFRYMLVEQVDVYDHVMRFAYEKDGVIPLLSRVEYVFPDSLNGAARYSVTLEYAERRDADGVDYLSDAAPGYESLLTQRLTAVNVFSNAERIRRYELAYEGYATSGGFTRLVGVQMLGLDGTVYPIRESFTYSRALGGICGDGEQADCQQPFLVDMGTVGDAQIVAGTATLIDINGDALPDVVDTAEGAHTFYLNQPRADGGSGFQPGGVASDLGSSAGHRLGVPGVQVMDVNGDGFTDMVNMASGQVLYNRGEGDWLSAEDVRAAGHPAFDARFDALGEDQLANVSFLDYDNDKFIDFILSDVDQTVIYDNLAADGFEVARGVELIGDGVSGDDLIFKDINGDGMLDATLIRPGEVRHRLNLGWGKWADWRSMPHPFEFGAQLDLAELEDLNGDGLADLVVVEADQVRYLLSEAGVSFAEQQIIDSDDIEGSLPQRGDEVEVLYADMNGNGSEDIVWIERAGPIRYLELFPIRPNLLTRIENGIGKVTDVTYGTSVQHQARDAAAGNPPWQYTLPHPMIVVDRNDTWDRLTNIHEVMDYTYHDGFYDGIEKQFRGYARVETMLQGDETQEEGRQLMEFDVGATDPYYNGLSRRMVQYSGDRELTVDEVFYDDCAVAEVPDALPDLQVRFICETGNRRVIKEGTDAADWITIESEAVFDGYGNVIESRKLGVTTVGGGACAPCTVDDFGAPCGESCRGDEAYTLTDFVPPANTGGRWMINRPYRERTFGEPGSDLYTEMLTYYDGDPFEGLPLMQLTRGDVTRVTGKRFADSDEVVEAERNRYDADGNVVEFIDADGALDGNDHRRIYTMDDDGLRVIRTDILLEDGEGPYRLRRDTFYEPVFDKIIESTAWMRVRGDDVLDTRRSTFFAYDDFARLTARILPGDSFDSPTETFEYALGERSSQILETQRLADGESIVSSHCMDGRGRVFQTRNLVEPGRVRVDGFKAFNIRGEDAYLYQPYESDTLDCEEAAPVNVRYTTFRRDASYRLLEITAPDADEFGEASVTRTVYTPLQTATYDHEDTDPESPHFDTPLIERMDGMERTVAFERTFSDGTSAVTRVHYDPLGRMSGYTDAAGNRKTQAFDLLDRVVSIDDPNAGEQTWQYSPSGSITHFTDGRGVTLRMDYDGANRIVEVWDEDDRDGTLVRSVYDTPADCPAVECANGAGRLLETHYPGGWDANGFDERGREVYSGRTIGGHLFVTRFEHDNADRVSRTVFPDGRSIDWVYDGESRVIEIPGVLDSMEYAPRGMPSACTTPDGVRNTMTYDARMRPATHTVTAADGTALLDLSYTRDRVGNLLEVADGSADHGGFRFDARYDYDAWYRTTRIELDPEGDGAETIDMGFDAIDNITRVISSLGEASPAHLGEFSYDGGRPNAATRVGALDLEYDGDGRMIGRAGSAYVWDYQGRLTAATTADGLQGRYTYDEQNNRVYKAEGDEVVYTVSPGYEVRDGIGVMYVRVDERNIARFESTDITTTLLSDIAPAAVDGETLEPAPDGAITAADAWLAHAAGAGIFDAGDAAPSDPVELLAAATRARLIEDREQTWLFGDHLGSPVLATRDGDATGRQHFTPLGAPRVEAQIDPFGFTEQEQDRTGLLRFGFRYYDPTIGRWLSPDPAFGVTDGENIGSHGEATTPYAYVANRFPNGIDRTGLDTEYVFAPTTKGWGGGDVKTAMSSAMNWISNENMSKGGDNKLGAVKGGDTLYVVGHGNHGKKIGSHSKAYTETQLVDLLISNGLKPGANKSTLTIELYACNSGSAYEGSDGSIQAPFAERFANAMAAKGFTNINVVGVIGFAQSQRYTSTMRSKAKTKKGTLKESFLRGQDRKRKYTIGSKGAVSSPKDDPHVVKKMKSPRRLSVHAPSKQ